MPRIRRLANFALVICFCLLDFQFFFKFIRYIILLPATAYRISKHHLEPQKAAIYLPINQKLLITKRICKYVCRLDSSMPDGYLIEIYSIEWLAVYVCAAFVLKCHPDTLPSCPTTLGNAAHLSMILPVPSGTRGSATAIVVVCSCVLYCVCCDNLISICNLSWRRNNNA